MNNDNNIIDTEEGLIKYHETMIDKYKIQYITYFMAPQFPNKNDILAVIKEYIDIMEEDLQTIRNGERPPLSNQIKLINLTNRLDEISTRIN